MAFGTVNVPGNSGGSLGRYGGSTLEALDELVTAGSYTWLAPAENPFGASEGALFSVIVDCPKYNENPLVVQTITQVHAAGGTLPTGATFCRTRYSAENWGEWVKIYNTTFTSIEALGLTNDEMSATELSVNMAKLFAAMPEGSRLMRSGETGTDNLAKSIAEKLAVDIGIPVDEYEITLEFDVKMHKPLAAELRVSITHIVPYVYDTYSCQYYNATLTAFHRNQPVEYYWNLKPEYCGYESLLEYMAARYSEHPVVFATVAGFSDLPDGVSSGQILVNLSGGVLSATLYTRTAIWYRATNSLTVWTEGWRNITSADGIGAVKKSGDVMTGALVAQNNTNYTTKQVRNIFLVAEGNSLPTGANGDVCLVYTP